MELVIEDHDASIRQELALSFQVLISFIKRCAETSERKGFDPPQNRLQLCGDADENPSRQ